MKILEENYYKAIIPAKTVLKEELFKIDFLLNVIV